MKRLIMVVCCVFICVGFTAIGHAALTTIGVATYGSQSYNLIHDDDGPLGPITWLDYTNSYNTKAFHQTWASNLGGALSVVLFDEYTSANASIDWSSGWRLPDAGPNPLLNQPAPLNSEVGHLYYTELGNPAGGISNTGDFNNLNLGFLYWTRTPRTGVSGYSWVFSFNNGYIFSDSDTYGGDYGIAVREGFVDVSVPIPGAVWLLGTGLIGIVGIRRKLKH